MPTIRDEFFRLKKIESIYLNENVINSLLMFVNDFKNHLELSINFEKDCKNTDILNESLNRILSGEPYQYVLNSASFCQRNFYVDKRVLIPRNETEELAITVIDMIKEFGFVEPNIFDICTGSGCIAITMDLEIANSKVFASDISSDCLDVCLLNQKRLKSNVVFKRGNLFEPFLKNRIDVLISNPPYVGKDEVVDSNVLKFEPLLALFAEPKTFFYENIFKQIKGNLNFRYLLAFEIGENMQEELMELSLNYFPDAEIVFKKDMYDRIRYLYILKK